MPANRDPMTRKGEDHAEGFAAESLKGARLKPGQSGGLHAEAGDGSPGHHSITGQNPEGVPRKGHANSNARGTQSKQGKDGNGTQKRQQEKKS
jgi:hypothetical protein